MQWDRLQMFWIKRRRIVAIILGLIGIGFGGMVGVGYAHAQLLIRQADRAMQAGNYTQAISDYQEAGLHFAHLRDQVATQLALAKNLARQQDYISAARIKMGGNDWQECVNLLKNITPTNPAYQSAQQLSASCQQRIAALAPSAVTAAAPAPTSTPSKPTLAPPTTVKKATNPPNPPSKTPSSNRPKSSNSPSSNSTALAACSGKNYFSVAPVPLADITGIIPLGHFNPSAHVFPTNHTYVDISSTNVPLSAPGDIHITDIISASGSNDYSIIYSPCTQITGQFGHVKGLTKSLLDQFNQAPTRWHQSYSTGGGQYSLVDKSVSIQVAAGQQIGSVGNNEMKGFDWYAYDTRATLSFANNSRWTGNLRSTVCPLDYYANASSFDKLFKDPAITTGNNQRTVAPLCGQFDQDVPGTAQGAWFAPGAPTTPEDPHLALAHDEINPGLGVFSIGTTFGNASGIGTGLFYFKPTGSGNVDRDFSQVKTDGQIYCYELQYYNDLSYPGMPDAGAVIVQLIDNNTLKIEKYTNNTCGPGPWSFGNKATTFGR